MGRPRIVLPVTVDQFFEKACLDQNRPPWTAIGTTELARLLDINPQNLWNWGVRRTGPPPEPDPGQVYRIGRAKLTVYRLDRICEWLDPGGRAPWGRARRDLARGGPRVPGGEFVLGPRERGSRRPPAAHRRGGAGAHRVLGARKPPAVLAQAV